MVHVPRITTNYGHEHEAVRFLQTMVNEYATAGWDFYRIDEINVAHNPSCIGAFLGQPKTVMPYYIVTFKRSKAGI